MATIYRKKGVWFLDYYINGKRLRKSLKTSSKKIAELALHDLEIKLAKNDLGLIVNEISLQAFTDKYLEYKKARVAPRTYQRIQIGIKHHILPFLEQNGVTKLNHITPMLIEEYVSFRAKDAKQATVNSELLVLKNILKMAIRWNYLQKDPAKEIKQFKVTDQKPPRFLTVEESQKLLESCNELMHKMVFTILHTGLRKEELTNLEWRDIDFKKQILTVAHEPPKRTLKGKESRYIPINPNLSEMLLQHRRETSTVDPHALVFPKKQGKRFDSFYYHLKMVYRKTSIEGANVHTLRHTFASHLVMQGVDLYTVSKLLGHKDVKTTQIYAHLAPDHLKAAIQKVPNFGHLWDTQEKNPQKTSANSIT